MALSEIGVRKIKREITERESVRVNDGERVTDIRDFGGCKSERW